ncbi:unnamed protein product [[Candida] boidinii]|nr:unnamed protein product [[Candida] boidinii]
MLGISREHGLLGKIDNKSIELLISGLESYLRSIIETSIDTVKYRRKKYEINDVTDGNSNNNNNNNNTNNNLMKIGKKNKRKNKRKIILTIEDMFDTFEKSPHIIEPGEPNLSLRYKNLQNDDMIDFSNLKYTKLKENLNTNTNITNTTNEIKSAFKSPIKNNINQSDILNQQKNGSVVKIEKQELNGGGNNENTNITTNNNNTNNNNNNNNNNNQQRTRQQNSINLSLSDPNLGSSNELNSLLNDLLST